MALLFCLNTLIRRHCNISVIQRAQKFRVDDRQMKERRVIGQQQGECWVGAVVVSRDGPDDLDGYQCTITNLRLFSIDLE